MENLFLTQSSLIGTIAFFVGVILLLIELLRRGLSRLSLFAYACFVVSSIFLSSDALSCVLAIGGLSALFLLLLLFYRKEQRRLRKNHTENEERK